MRDAWGLHICGACPKRLVLFPKFLIFLGFASSDIGLRPFVSPTCRCRCRHCVFVGTIPRSFRRLAFYAYSPGIHGLAGLCVFASGCCGWRGLGCSLAAKAAKSWPICSSSTSCCFSRRWYRNQSSCGLQHSHVLRREMMPNPTIHRTSCKKRREVGDFER